MVNCVSILGSTGSIGRQSLDIISRLPSVKVAALTAGTSVERMAQQCREFRPELAVMATQEAALQLAEAIKDLPTRVSWGEEGLIEAATIPAADCVITAVVGMVGLKPTLAAIRAKKRIGLANKETLVCAGEIVMDEAEKYGVEIIPVDSEHSAIFQCLMGSGNKREVKRLILTCSGGPFFGMSRQQLEGVTKADALKHPNWKMGAKITIDCATLMNKGLTRPTPIFPRKRLCRKRHSIQTLLPSRSMKRLLRSGFNGNAYNPNGAPYIDCQIHNKQSWDNMMQDSLPSPDEGWGDNFGSNWGESGDSGLNVFG